MDKTTTKSPRPASDHTRHWGQIVIEVLGYAGAILVIIAGFSALHDLWPTAPVWAELVFAAVAAVSLGGAGAALHARSGTSGPAARLRAAFWLLSATSLAALAYLAAEHLLQVSDTTATIIAASAGGAYAAALWRITGHALQEIAVFAAILTLVLAVGVQFRPFSSSQWWPAAGIWATSAAWAVLVHRGYLAPRTTGFVLASLGLYTSAQFFENTRFGPSGATAVIGPVLALLTVTGLLAAGIWLRQWFAVAAGAVGIVQFVPQVAGQLLPSGAAVPIGILFAGLMLVAAALWLARRTRRDRTRPGDAGTSAG